jgi:hypothetical protein
MKSALIVSLLTLLRLGLPALVLLFVGETVRHFSEKAPISRDAK